MRKDRKIRIVFCTTFILVIAFLGFSVLKNNAYNNTRHHKIFSGSTLFGVADIKSKDISVNAVPRSGTWTKLFDMNNEGLTEHNYQAYTYDFTISNNTKDEVSDFAFKLTFNREVFLQSAWNGALEIHQNVSGEEIVSTIPDLRTFDANSCELQTVTFDGETLIRMSPKDYLIYLPNSSTNAMEIPIEPLKSVAPGIILYVPIGENIDGTMLDMEYTYHRLLTKEPLFWIALVSVMSWLIALIIHVITSSQIKKYNERHKRDNEII
ncbi:MAG: hypothetical protein K6G30_05635, partial [Acetatifactor sp.]|nr:hypothetical protein [Acetatifactor sp.]